MGTQADSSWRFPWRVTLFFGLTSALVLGCSVSLSYLLEDIPALQPFASLAEPLFLLGLLAVLAALVGPFFLWRRRQQGHGATWGYLLLGLYALALPAAAGLLTVGAYALWPPQRGPQVHPIARMNLFNLLLVLLALASAAVSLLGFMGQLMVGSRRRRARRNALTLQ